MKGRNAERRILNKRLHTLKKKMRRDNTKDVLHMLRGSSLFKRLRFILTGKFEH